ncbi:MAG: hypothetical protein ABIH40_05475 [Candidatus Omnitrophota bacterium]
MKSRRGVALILILAVILAVVFVANIALVLISSQSRLTHHQVSRIQAFYAAQAGINYALERIRQGDSEWIPIDDSGANTRDRYICREAGPPSNCTDPVNDVIDDLLPLSVREVNINIGAAGSGVGGSIRRVTATADYTY